VRCALLLLAVASVLAAACSDTGATGQPDATPSAASTNGIGAPTQPATAPSETTVARPGSTPVTGQTATIGEAVLGPFEIVTADGLTLEGFRFGSGTTFVVLAHMRPAEMSSWFAFAGLLAGDGYTAITFNFRGYGNSDGAGFAVDVDVAAAVDAAIALGARKVFVVGASMGATGSVVAASRRDVAGVIALSAPAEFLSSNAEAAARTVTAPMLLIAAADDLSYADEAERIRAASGGPAEVVILPGRRHGTDLFQQHSEQLTALILDFLALP
jgi:pimeloyl-ACP methyl ester carboxylesterase